MQRAVDRVRGRARRRRRFAVAAAAAIAAAAPAGCGDNLTHPGADAGASPLACLPNLDGRIDADELPVVAGTAATYLVGHDRPVDLAGPPWNWSDDAPGDVKQSFVAEPVAGQWYAAAFVGAEVAVPIDAGGALVGLYARDADALWFFGVASTAPDATLLPYDRPVALYRFPIEVGRRYEEVGTVTGGRIDGVPYSGTDTYAIDVDARGALALPHLSFADALRVRTRVTVAPAVGGVTVTRRQVSLLFECFGEVARATSR
ncbi:MAG: hypothetical protein D6689_02670, partial [Deltaproteobacteria bacterium]